MTPSHPPSATSGRPSPKSTRPSHACSSLDTGAEGDTAEADTTKEAVPAPQAPPVPLPKLEDVRTVLAQKYRAGHTAQVRKLLGKYGATRLCEVDPTDYPALLEDAGAI